MKSKKIQVKKNFSNRLAVSSIKEVTKILQSLLQKASLLLAFITISLWFWSWAVAEYLLTEHWFIIPRLTSTQASLWLICIIAIVASIAQLFKLWDKKIRLKTAIIITIFFIISVIVYGRYQQHYSWLQTIPKIKSISKNWSIQGDLIAIEGKNFGEAWRAGSVKVGELEYVVRSWPDARVVVEQPLIQDYQFAPLILSNYHNNQATIENFELRDPADVL
jgi:hypothetical protein